MALNWPGRPASLKPRPDHGGAGENGGAVHRYLTKGVYMLRASLALAVLAAVSSLAQALPVEHSGAPAKNIAPIGHYGLDVSAKRALKALTPEGWGVYLHKDAKLPESISWSHTDTWLSALQTFSDRSGLRVEIDWDANAIYIKPPTMSSGAGPAKKPFAPLPSIAAARLAPGLEAVTVSAGRPTIALKLAEGQLVSMALGGLATQSGWVLRWEAPDDFEVASDTTLTGQSFRDVLEKTLIRMGLSADWYPDSKVAVVSKKN